MIINHEYKFIFIKTRKTAGTSLEIALSKFCGEQDVITPVKKKDEELRQNAGFRGPQNEKIPWKFYIPSDYITSLLEKKPRRFYNHAGIHLIKKSIPRNIWDRYYKFTIERDPFDKAVSRYFWSTRNERPDGLTEYLDSAPAELLSNWELYTDNDQIAVDHVIRYENLQEELGQLCQKLALPETLELPHAKGSFRKNREHYSRIIPPEARKRIEVVCAREIAAFGYKWVDA